MVNYLQSGVFSIDFVSLCAQIANPYWRKRKTGEMS